MDSPLIEMKTKKARTADGPRARSDGKTGIQPGELRKNGIQRQGRERYMTLSS
jgi:hypothetical protein